MCCVSDYPLGMYSLYSVDCVDNDVVQNFNFVDHILKMVSNDPSLQNMTALLRSFLPCPPERVSAWCSSATTSTFTLIPDIQCPRCGLTDISAITYNLQHVPLVWWEAAGAGRDQVAEGGAALQQARVQPRHLPRGLRQVGASRCLDSVYICNDMFGGGRGRPTACTASWRSPASRTGRCG